MEDNVSFKVFLKNKEEQEVRRFVIDKNVSTSFDYLVGKLRVIFPQIQASVFTVGWTDEDGDQVTITSDEELIIALTEMTGPLYKLTVTVKKTGQAPAPAGGGEEVVVHYGVTCDGCDLANITGPRYKCVVCDDYDLCGGCEAAGRHPGHNMMKITTPGNVFPHRLFKRIQRLQEKAEKKTGGANEKWNEKLEKDMKQVEEQLKNIPQCGFSGFSGPAQHCFGFGPRGRGLFRGGRGGLGGRQGRGGWAGAAPAWAAMMSGWTGEQQQPANSGQEKKAETGEAQQQHLQEQHQEFVKIAEEAARQAHAEAHSAAQAAGAAGLLSGSEDYLQNVGSFVAAALDPLGIDVKIDIETPEGRKSCHVSRQASTASASTSASTSAGEKQEKKEEKEEKKKEEEEQVVINEEKKADSEPAKKAGTPSDDEEDWTVVTDKKDAGAAGQDPALSLYPTLTENPPADVPTAPVASHPDPKIQVALQAMMNMGFSNEGGWLSSLLEAKNGDIGKVLDILQPVKK